MPRCQPAPAPASSPHRNLIPEGAAIRGSRGSKTDKKTGRNKGGPKAHRLSPRPVRGLGRPKDEVKRYFVQRPETAPLFPSFAPHTPRSFPSVPSPRPSPLSPRLLFSVGYPLLVSRFVSTEGEWGLVSARLADEAESKKRASWVSGAN